MATYVMTEAQTAAYDAGGQEWHNVRDEVIGAAKQAAREEMGDRIGVGRCEILTYDGIVYEVVYADCDGES